MNWFSAIAILALMLPLAQIGADEPYGHRTRYPVLTDNHPLPVKPAKLNIYENCVQVAKEQNLYSEGVDMFCRLVEKRVDAAHSWRDP